ncbi:MAG TPA: hypothetical protein PLH57_03645 [Oligoflexia bacterium]|nr:hypothetical protein [Oligoflexia bacterium]
MFKFIATAFVLGLPVLAQAEVPSLAIGAEVLKSPCPAGPDTNFNLTRAYYPEVFNSLDQNVYSNAKVLNCENDPNYYILAGTTGIQQEEKESFPAFYGNTAPGYKVVRTIPKKSVESLYVFSFGSPLIARGIDATHLECDRNVDHEENNQLCADLDDITRKTAVGGLYHYFYVDHGKSKNCEGKYELFASNLKSIRNYDESMEKSVYEMQNSSALGVCFNDEKSFQQLREKPPVEPLKILDFKWKNDDVVDLLVYRKRKVAGSRKDEISLLNYRVDLAAGKASEQYKISGEISEIEIFPNSCGEYALTARILGDGNVAIFYPVPRVVFVNVQNANKLRAKIEYEGSSRLMTCEGGGPRFEYGRSRFINNGYGYSYDIGAKISFVKYPYGENYTGIHWWVNGQGDDDHLITLSNSWHK